MKLSDFIVRNRKKFSRRLDTKLEEAENLLEYDVELTINSQKNMFVASVYYDGHEDKFKIFVESESAATEEVLFHELSHICLNARGWVKYKTYSQAERDKKLDTVLNWILSLIQHPPIWTEMSAVGYDIQREETTLKAGICNVIQRRQFCHEYFPNERLHPSAYPVMLAEAIISPVSQNIKECILYYTKFYYPSIYNQTLNLLETYKAFRPVNTSNSRSAVSSLLDSLGLSISMYTASSMCDGDKDYNTEEDTLSFIIWDDE